MFNYVNLSSSHHLTLRYAFEVNLRIYACIYVNLVMVDFRNFVLNFINVCINNNLKLFDTFEAFVYAEE